MMMRALNYFFGCACSMNFLAGLLRSQKSLIRKKFRKSKLYQSLDVIIFYTK